MHAGPLPAELGCGERLNAACCALLQLCLSLWLLPADQLQPSCGALVLQPFCGRPSSTTGWQAVSRRRGRGGGGGSKQAVCVSRGCEEGQMGSGTVLVLYEQRLQLAHSA